VLAFEKPQPKKLAEQLEGFASCVSAFGRAVSKVETDFAYQYNYNRELIEENEGLRKRATAAETDLGVREFELTSLRDGFKTIHNHLESNILSLKESVSSLSKPSRLWRRIALSLLLVGTLGWSAFFYEKFVQPLDVVLEQIKIALSI
jgi:hypothetical protein